jgi:putative transposase
MPDHLHLITSQVKGSSQVLRYLKGITGRRVIDHLKEQNFQTSLSKLRHDERKRKHTHSVWQEENNVFSIFSEQVLMQKVNYIHLNPVRAQLVENAIDYKWSSARIWRGCSGENEPLMDDCHAINWRSGAQPRR